ncbi:unnamed protein product, partial [Oppiella nova]
GEILVSRDKLDDIVSAAKFLQIEGAKDFILPKNQPQRGDTHPHQTTGAGTGSGGNHYNNNTGVTGHTNSASRMQIDLQHMKTMSSLSLQRQLAAAQASQHHKQMSLLSKMMVQRPQTAGAAAKGTGDQSTGGQSPAPGEPEVQLRHAVKRELIDEELEDEEDVDELDEEVSAPEGTGSDGKAAEKSGMFAEFEDQSGVVSNSNATNNGNTGRDKSAPNEGDSRHSEDSSAGDEDEEDMDEEAMDVTTSAATTAAILAKVPPGTSVSTTGADGGGDAQHKSDNLNVPTRESEDDIALEEEEEYEDEFDEEELLDEEQEVITGGRQHRAMSMGRALESQQSMDTPLARAIAASTLASFGAGAVDMDSEVSQSSSGPYSSPKRSLTITAHTGSERRGRGRPPKYDMGSIFTGLASGVSAASIVTPTVIMSAQSTAPSATATSAQSSSASATRSRRGRPPSMPEELLRSLTGRLDKAHHKCPHCPQIYYGYHAMRDHITSVHLNSGEKYICNLCNKEYTWRITLRKHLKFHHGVHPDQVQNA